MRAAASEGENSIEARERFTSLEPGKEGRMKVKDDNLSFSLWMSNAGLKCY